jgi:Protein of unknown function (DUF3306)
MSEPKDTTKNFLLRWSRRKRAASERAADVALVEQRQQTDSEANAGRQSQEDPVLPALGPEDLPPIESITATTDLRAFLKPGVPEDLIRSALRRAWVTDPAIRNFIGIAENQWDFTKPETIPGFGSLELTPELRRMVADLVGGVDRQSERSHPEDASCGGEQQRDTSTPAASANAQAGELRASNKSDQNEMFSVDVVPVARQSDESSGTMECPDASQTNSSQLYRKHGKATPK